jgi:DNA-binding MarR family transcriptional regulator
MTHQVLDAIATILKAQARQWRGDFSPLDSISVVLLDFHYRGENLFLHEIESLTHASSPTVRRKLRYLEQKGIVTIECFGADKRRKVVRISEKGLNLLEPYYVMVEARLAAGRGGYAAAPSDNALPPIAGFA